MNRLLKWASVVSGSVAALSFTCVYGASVYYSSEHGQGCASCHEMASYTSVVHGSAHRDLTCVDCHKATLATKLRHTAVHVTRSWPESIRLREADVEPMTSSCESCHRHEYASWHVGPHSVTFSQIFTDSKHNGKRMLMDDCLRCHGAFFNGAIRDLVQPLNTKGPWRLTRNDLADHFAMPCITCHQVHTQGAPLARPTERISVTQDSTPLSLAFYDRRESLNFAAVELAIPHLYDGARAVTISQDPRQSLCYQCHAPREPETGSVAAANALGPQVGSGDDRTPMGVHEGISCIACHDGHNENTRASCKTCHPAMSNCGIDVEKMDTTYASSSSPHNIHWVKCVDCHRNGIPRPSKPAAIKAKLATTPGMSG